MNQPPFIYEGELIIADDDWFLNKCLTIPQMNDGEGLGDLALAHFWPDEKDVSLSAKKITRVRVTIELIEE